MLYVAFRYMNLIASYKEDRVCFMLERFLCVIFCASHDGGAFVLRDYFRLLCELSQY